MIANNFKDVFKKIESKINQSSNQAMNKALTNTKTYYAKTISQALGIPSTRVKARAKINKVNKSFNVGSLDIGVRVRLAAQDFNPKRIAVDSKTGKKFGTTIKIGNASREFIPNAFMLKAKSGKNIVISRVSESRYPTKTVLLDVFRHTVNDHKPMLFEFLRESFEKNLRSQLSYNLSKD